MMPLSSKIDLIRLKHDNSAVILKLIRSYPEVDDWAPYPADYPDFYLLERLSIKSEEKFFICYNQCTTKPEFFDDESVISVFDFNNGHPNKIGVYEFEQVFR